MSTSDIPSDNQYKAKEKQNQHVKRKEKEEKIDQDERRCTPQATPRTLP
jgi:hypothetical protein